MPNIYDLKYLRNWNTDFLVLLWLLRTIVLYTLMQKGDSTVTFVTFEGQIFHISP